MLEGPRALPVCLSVKNSSEDGDQKSNCGIQMTRKNRGTRRETGPNATLSTTNPIRTDPGSKPGSLGYRPATAVSRNYT